MCGIAGWLSAASAPVADPEQVIHLLKHRGPDSTGFETCGDAALVHTRLRVLDLTDAGHQPAWSEDRTIAVVFNGEIYNHRELRTELGRRGHRFHGHADTEVIAPLYQEFGQHFVEKLRGMFAIGLVDTRRGHLLLARDRFGIKPLYWARCEGGIAFASEIPPLRLVRGVDLTLDPQAIADFVSLHQIPPPQTVLRGVRSLEPGTILQCTLRPELHVGLSRYHQWRFEPSPTPGMGLDENVELVGQHIDRAVSSQLESDVPLGGMLSGGIDSGLVCHAAHHALPDGIRTFGVSFDDPTFDEREAFESAAASIGTHHETLHFDGVASSWSAVSQVLLAAGQPFADSSILAVDALSRLLREHVTVALSGDGGDEAFAGYDQYGLLYGLAPLARMPPGIRGPVLHGMASIQQRLPPGLLRRMPSQLPSRLHDLADARSTAEIVADQKTWIRPHEHARAWAGPQVEPVSRLFERQWPGQTGQSRLSQLFDTMTEVDVRIRLAGDFLPKVDIASMRHSLEVRVPMLDEDLFQFGLSLPRVFKHPSRGPGKLVLRRLASDRIPSIAHLPKHGFGVPFDRWVDKEFRTALRDTLTPSALVHDWLDPAWTEPLIAAFNGREVPPELTRQGLYQRIVMLTALELHLQAGRA